MFVIGAWLESLGGVGRLERGWGGWLWWGGSGAGPGREGGDGLRAAASDEVGCAFGMVRWRGIRTG